MVIFGIHVYQIKTVTHVRMVAPLYWSFELPPFNDFYREKLVCFIKIITFDIFL